MTISATTRGLRPGVCTSSTRPSSPFDGQLIYETDTNRVAVYDTNTWVYKTPDTTAGSVLQVVSTTKTDTYTATSSTYVDITGLSATITPKFSTSKILVMVSMVATGQSATTTAHFQLARSGTAIGIGDAGGASQVRGTSYARDSDRPMSISMTFLDSPATTSSVTYSVQQRNEGSGTVYVNRSQTDTNFAYYGRSSSTITVMEIAQ